MCKQNSIYITQVLLQQNPNTSATHFHSHSPSPSPSPTQTHPSLVRNQCLVWINPPSQTCRSLETHTKPKSPIKNQNQTRLIRISTRSILTLMISSKNQQSIIRFMLNFKSKGTKPLSFILDNICLVLRVWERK